MVLGKSFFAKKAIFSSQKGDASLNIPLGKDLCINFNKINAVINKEAFILITDLNGVIIYLNEECSAALGFKSNELIGKHTRVFKTGIHTTDFYHNLWATVLSGEIWKGEISAKRKDGSVQWFFMYIYPLLDDRHQPYQFLTIRTDITDLKKTERAHIKEKKINSIIGNLTNEVVGCIDQYGKIHYLSPAVEDILGYKVSESIGLSIYDYIDPKTLTEFKNSIEELKKVPGSSNSVKMNIKIRRKSGSLLLCEFNAKNYLNDDVLKAIVFTYREIKEQEKFQHDLDRLVNFDSLTGLPNYINFKKRLNHEIEHSKEMNTSLAVIKVDLDDFKYVNSTLGYQKGDLLLKEFTNRMKNALPEKRTMYRISEDAFALLMEDIVDVEEVSGELNRLISTLNNEPFKIEKNEIFATASMGASIFPYSGENGEELLKNADIAMYRAKFCGKNQFQIFSPTMNVYSYKKFVLRNDSKKALERNEFCIYYQPRINPKTNEMVSAEALIRWNHPKWGVVLPEEFISMAEESGLIIPIGAWLIGRVCSEIKKWEEDNLPVNKISINVSALQLLQPNFIDMVTSTLEMTRINPKQIEFEITESVIIENEEQVLNQLTALKNMGMTIALDDFGTGYSSLNYFKKFPCDVIKIDKSLIKDIDKNKDNLEIIGAVISLCHKLKKSVVAEGVEIKEQLFILQNLHCDEIQGYLYSQPVDEQEYKKLLREGIKFQINPSDIHDLEANRRKYFRIPLEIPLLADMTIEKIGDQKINIKTTEVMIKNIGPGGLCFNSPLKLPVSKKITLLFMTEILSEKLELRGNVVWNKEMANNEFQYGVELTTSNVGERLIKILNNFQVKLRHNLILPDCRFSTK